VPFVVFFLLIVLAIIALIPLSIVQRFRAGTARRVARGWVATINLVGLALSVALFLTGAAVTNVWVPDAFLYSVLGLCTGCLLGMVGLALTRWERAPQSLHYTPNRWLVLAITLVVATRLAYGFWRSWQAWNSGLEGASWFVTAGVAGSLAAGAIVLGYYLTYWFGLRWKVRRHVRRGVG
jgi:hypothetical protein